MTTIVWADRQLWVDSRVTRGNYVVAGGCDKLIPLGDGRVAAGAGPSHEIDRFIEWIKTGKQTEAPALTDGAVIVVLQMDGSCVEYWDGDEQIVNGTYEAWGSGAKYALGALAAGVDPEKAMESAYAHDTGSGGPTRVASVPGSVFRPLAKSGKR